MHMIFVRFRARWIVVILLCVVSTGCSTFRTKGGLQLESAVETPNRELEEARLRGFIGSELSRVQRQSDSGSSQLVRQRPFYYREYVEYPDGTDSFEMNVIDVDSRTTPFTAQAQVRKIRFATLMHRDRDEARHDEHFYRDTGREYISYELSNGRWRRLGSLFVAEKTEEQINGEWQPAYRNEQDNLLEESEEKGFFSRVWDAIIFWR